MQEAAGITVMSFGQGRRRVPLTAGEATVGEVIRKTGLSPDGRRIAVNGRKADGNTVVVEGDLVTLMPRVEGG